MEETDTRRPHVDAGREHSRSPACISNPTMLEALARDNAQIAADFLWAGNRERAREHLRRALEQIEMAEERVIET